MTTREFYVAVAGSNVSEELVTKAQELLAAHDAKNAKRKATPTKEQKEAEERKLAVLDFFYSNQEKPMTRDDIAAALGIRPSQVSAACKPLLEEQFITKAEAKIGKSRKVVYIMPREN